MGYEKIRKILSMLVFVMLLTVGLTVTVNASSYYTDVSSSDPYYNAVTYLKDHNIMVGQTDTYFGKNDTLIRADVVTILWRMLNQPEPSGTTVTFPDCNSGAYYYKAVRWACSSNVGIASGYENGKFGPADLVSNQDLLTFLHRFACYCGYINNSSSAQANYRTAFEQSALSYLNTFWDYSKVPVGWAYQTGFITNYTIKGTASATRGDTAKYVYHFYQRYQKKYGLVVVNTDVDNPNDDVIYAERTRTAMNSLLYRNGVNVFSYCDITENDFEDAMERAFGNAKKFDLCYLYVLCHGSETRIALFSDSNYLTPSELRALIDVYDGTFITFVNSCHAGIFITSPNSIEESSLYEFDIESFVSELVGSNNVSGDEIDIMYTNSGNLSGSNRIKVLGACYWDEVSYQADKNATYYWCRGSSYDFNSGNSISKYADTNTDGRISLFELYVYSYNKVLNRHPDQHIVHYPYGDDYIILESNY